MQEAEVGGNKLDGARSLHSLLVNLIFLQLAQFLDSIAVSLFTNGIRWQGPNNYSDTVARSFVYNFKLKTLAVLWI